jgi:hypothetical protein
MSKRRDKKRRRAQHHTLTQRRKKEQALLDATEEALHVGKSGQRLKRPRSGDALVQATREAMKQRGYVPNGKGGWRKYLPAELPDTITKEG